MQFLPFFMLPFMQFNWGWEGDISKQTYHYKLVGGGLVGVSSSAHKST